MSDNLKLKAVFLGYFWSIFPELSHGIQDRIFWGSFLSQVSHREISLEVLKLSLFLEKSTFLSLKTKCLVDVSTKKALECIFVAVVTKNEREVLEILEDPNLPGLLLTS